MLALYGYEHGGGDDWQSPFQTSGSFATRDCGDHWTSLSGSDATEEIGAASATVFASATPSISIVHFKHQTATSKPRSAPTGRNSAWGARITTGRRRAGLRLVEDERAAGGEGEAKPEPEDEQPKDEPGGAAADVSGASTSARAPCGSLATSSRF